MVPVLSPLGTAAAAARAGWGTLPARARLGLMKVGLPPCAAAIRAACCCWTTCGCNRVEAYDKSQLVYWVFIGCSCGQHGMKYDKLSVAKYV